MKVRAGRGLVAAAAQRPPDTLTTIEEDLSSLAIETFAKAVGGRDNLTSVLVVAEAAPECEKVVNLLLDPRFQGYSLRRLCTMAGITVADLFTAYRKALITKAHIEAAHIVASKLPPIVADVMTRAAPTPMVCPNCAGAGDKATCALCLGTGVVLSEPELDRQKLALELGQLTTKGGGFTIQNNNQVVANATVASAATGSLEQLHQAVGDLLFSPERRRTGSPLREPDTLDVPRGDPPNPAGPPDPDPDDDGDDDHDDDDGEEDRSN
jgi:hypothetical protein